MNAARRAPRAQGITVSFFAAAATTPLMKRVLVFMALILSLFGVGVCPCLRMNMPRQSGRFLAVPRKFTKNDRHIETI
jgi:hypothetical protein